MNRILINGLRFAFAAILAGCASSDSRWLPTAIESRSVLEGARTNRLYTTVFAAEVSATVPRPESCPQGAFICGTASLAGFGSAEYLFFLQSLGPGDQPCLGANGPSPAGAYVATVTFTLADGSQLTLEEAGTVCGPGLSLSAPGGNMSYGNPVDGRGAWRVQEATGQFAGLLTGGTSTFHSSGADFRASYIVDAFASGAP